MEHKGQFFLTILNLEVPMSWWKAKEDGFFYEPKERAIYKYWDGQKYVDEDPMLISRRMAEVAPELKIDLTVADSPSKDAAKAAVMAVQKARKIFNVKAFAEGGLLEDELWELFNSFLEWRNGVKKNLKKSVTSVTATPPSIESSPAVNPSVTENGLASGSTADVPATEQAEPLPTESPSVLASPVQV